MPTNFSVINSKYFKISVSFLRGFQKDSIIQNHLPAPDGIKQYPAPVSTGTTSRIPGTERFPLTSRRSFSSSRAQGLPLPACGGILLSRHGRRLHGNRGLHRGPPFLESWLGMRYEMIDMSEFTRRINGRST